MPYTYETLDLLLWQVKLVIREEAFNRKLQSGVIKMVRVSMHRTPVDILHIVKRNLQVNSQSCSP